MALFFCILLKFLTEPSTRPSCTCEANTHMYDSRPVLSLDPKTIKFKGQIVDRAIDGARITLFFIVVSGSTLTDARKATTYGLINDFV